MAVEAKRGCGFRKVGGLYLVADGAGENCDALPIPVEPCAHCGMQIPRTRGFQFVKAGFIHRVAAVEAAGHDSPHCAHCPICNPDRLAETADPSDRFGLIWIGKGDYPTPEAFLAEAGTLGISRRVPALPKGLVIGKTWVLMGHLEGRAGRCPECEENLQFCEPGVAADAGMNCETCDGKGTVPAPAIFQAFRVQRVELIVTAAMRTEEWVEKLVEKGVSLVEVPEDDPDHRPRRSKKTGRRAAVAALAVEADAAPPVEAELPLGPPVPAAEEETHRNRLGEALDAARIDLLAFLNAPVEVPPSDRLFPLVERVHRAVDGIKASTPETPFGALMQVAVATSRALAEVRSYLTETDAEKFARVITGIDFARTSVLAAIEAATDRTVPKATPSA